MRFSLLLLSLCISPTLSAQIVWQTDVLGETAEELLLAPDGSLILIGNGPQVGAATNYLDLYVTAFSAAGDSLWRYTLSSEGNGVESQDAATDAVVAPDGSILVSGYLNYRTSQAVFAKQGVVVKLSASGEEVWQYVFGEEGNVEDVALAARLAPNGDALVFGTTGGPRDELFTLLRLNGSDGSLVWRTDYDASPDGQDPQYVGMVLTDDGKLIVHASVPVEVFGNNSIPAPAVFVFDLGGKLEASQVFDAAPDRKGETWGGGIATDGTSLFATGQLPPKAFGEKSPSTFSRYGTDGTRSIDTVIFPDSSWTLNQGHTLMEVDAQRASMDRRDDRRFVRTW